VVVGLIAVVLSFETGAIVGLYVLLLLNAGVKQFFDPAHDSLIPELADDEELAAANSFLSIASFGSTAIGFAGAGLLAAFDLRIAFVLDAISFVVCAVLVALMGRYPMPMPDDEASVAVVIDNLKSGLGTLFGTPILRSLLLVGALVFFSFGLWNVLLLPMSLRELHATEFQYGLQEGVTSLGFVAGSFFMARFSSRLPEPIWMALGLAIMSVCGFGYAAATSVPIAIALVTVSGFFNSPVSVSRAVLLQRNTPRDMRGRVFSAYYVMRDVIFLFGMAAAGLADVINVRVLIGFSALLTLVGAATVLVAPGLGIASLRAARARLAEGATALGAAPLRPATLADFDRLVGRLSSFARLNAAQRESFIHDAAVREVPAGTRIVEHGDSASSAYFILDGSATAGVPEEGGYRGLSTMGEGDFFGEIAALTGSPRTADVVADVDSTLLEVPAEALRTTMSVPEIQKLVFSTLTSRLIRTESADLPRLAGLDQESLRDLRTPRPSVEALPRTYTGEPAS
jgi:CRP-like cAMP-binding protein